MSSRGTLETISIGKRREIDDVGLTVKASFLYESKCLLSPLSCVLVLIFFLVAFSTHYDKNIGKSISNSDNPLDNSY